MGFSKLYIKAHHLFISRAKSIQSTKLPTDLFKIQCMLYYIILYYIILYYIILSSHLSLGLPRLLFPPGFLTKTLFALLIPIRVKSPIHLIFLDLIFRPYDEQYKPWSSLSRNYPSLMLIPPSWTHISCSVHYAWTLSATVFISVDGKQEDKRQKSIKSYLEHKISMFYFFTNFQ